MEVKESAGRPVQEDGASSGLAVALPSGRRIEIGRGFDSRTLVQLLACWSGRHARVGPATRIYLAAGPRTCARASRASTVWRATGCCAIR